LLLLFLLVLLLQIHKQGPQRSFSFLWFSISLSFLWFCALPACLAMKIFVRHEKLHRAAVTTAIIITTTTTAETNDRKSRSTRCGRSVHASARYISTLLPSCCLLSPFVSKRYDCWMLLKKINIFRNVDVDVVVSAKSCCRFYFSLLLFFFRLFF